MCQILWISGGSQTQAVGRESEPKRATSGAKGAQRTGTLGICETNDRQPRGARTGELYRWRRGSGGSVQRWPDSDGVPARTRSRAPNGGREFLSQKRPSARRDVRGNITTDERSSIHRCSYGGVQTKLHNRPMVTDRNQLPLLGIAAAVDRRWIGFPTVSL